MLQQILKDTNAANALLVAVSKTKPNEQVLDIYNQGHRTFGENKVQELKEKHKTLPKDIDWHFIGHLQTNKVKDIAPFVKLIHAVDSLKLLKEINKQAAKNERVIDCLLQFHIAEESTKFGLHKDDAEHLLQSAAAMKLANVRIVGVMGMATFTDNKEQIRNEFKTLRNIFKTLKDGHFKNAAHFKEISMGMSGDYKIALKEGSTMVRVGSLIFGVR